MELVKFQNVRQYNTAQTFKKKPLIKNLKSIFMHMHKTKQNHTGRTYHNITGAYLHAVEPVVFLFLFSISGSVRYLHTRRVTVCIPPSTYRH